MGIISEIFKRGKFDDIQLAVDIGTGSVKTASFKINQDNKIEIIGVGRSLIEKNSDEEGGFNKTVIARAAKKAVREVFWDQEPPRFQPAIMGISGSFLKGIASSFKHTRDNPEIKIEEAEVANLIQKFEYKALEKIKSDFIRETGWHETDLNIVNALVQETRIDGWQVDDIFGKDGKELEFKLFNTFIPKINFEELTSIIRDIGINPILTTIQMLGVTGVLKWEEFSPSRDVILIDIGYESTDISIVRSGILEGIKTFSFGGKALTRRISKTFGVGYQEAEDIKISFSNKKLSKAVLNKIAKILEKDFDTWASGVILNLESFSKTELFPKNIFLFGGSSHISGLAKSLANKKLKDNLPFTEEPKIDFLSFDKIKGISDPKNFFKDRGDIPLFSLARLLPELASNKKEISRILGRVLRMMKT